MAGIVERVAAERHKYECVAPWREGKFLILSRAISAELNAEVSGNPNSFARRMEIDDAAGVRKFDGMTICILDGAYNSNFVQVAG